MKPTHEGDRYKLYQGDSLKVLSQLPAASVHTCITSPPYFGLRDYQTAEWLGGDENCDHANGVMASPKSTLRGGKLYEGEKLVTNGMPYKDICGKCGAVRVDDQIGLEKTPEEYIAKLVNVFREVKRVLRDDGVLWVNIGDSYAGSGCGWGGGSISERYGTHEAIHGTKEKRSKNQTPPAGLKPKDLIGIPWMLAFALRADGWYLRQDIIWHKPNTLPESVTDRCTKAHEYIFLLSKSARYYYDHEAIKEPSLEPWRAGKLERRFGPARPVGTMRNDTDREVMRTLARNKRSVWTVSTKPYPEAHFATFNPELIEPCILAGCPAGGWVLDPFAGSGTTIATAIDHGRKGIGIELNADYLGMAKRRIDKSVSIYSNSNGRYMPAPKDPQNQLSLFWEAQP